MIHYVYVHPSYNSFWLTFVDFIENGVYNEYYIDHLGRYNEERNHIHTLNERLGKSQIVYENN